MLHNNQGLSAGAAKWADMPLHNWEDAFLEQKRHQCDPVADALVAEIIASGEREQVNSFYRNIQYSYQAAPDDMPPALRAFFSTEGKWPDWADPSLIRKGEDFYLVHGSMIALLLCFKSLPECYACAKGAMVLHQSGQLVTQRGGPEPYTHRITETAQFVVNIMSPGGLSAYGKGVHTAQKIRLIHASVRHYMRSAGWDATLYDEPINQEDLAGTLMSFSSLILEGLERFNIRVSDEEKEAYFHCWRVAGYFMGIDEDLLPNNNADGLALGYKILQRQQKDSEQGRHLTQSLIDWLQVMVPLHAFDHIVYDMLRFAMGNNLSDLLGVPAVSASFFEKASQAFTHYLGGWENFVEKHEVIHAIARPLNRILLNSMLQRMNNGERVTFYIPEALQETWGLREPDAPATT